MVARGLQGDAGDQQRQQRPVRQPETPAGQLQQRRDPDGVAFVADLVGRPHRRPVTHRRTRTPLRRGRRRSTDTIPSLPLLRPMAAGAHRKPDEDRAMITRARGSRASPARARSPRRGPWKIAEPEGAPGWRDSSRGRFVVVRFAGLQRLSVDRVRSRRRNHAFNAKRRSRVMRDPGPRYPGLGGFGDLDTTPGAHPQGLQPPSTAGRPRCAPSPSRASAPSPVSTKVWYLGPVLAELVFPEQRCVPGGRWEAQPPATASSCRSHRQVSARSGRGPGLSPGLPPCLT